MKRRWTDSKASISLTVYWAHTPVVLNMCSEWRIHHMHAQTSLYTSACKSTVYSSWTLVGLIYTMLVMCIDGDKSLKYLNHGRIQQPVLVGVRWLLLPMSSAVGPLAVGGPMASNSLPDSLCLLDPSHCSSSFRRNLKTVLFARYYCTERIRDASW